jgi:hypothetical protein
VKVYTVTINDTGDLSTGVYSTEQAAIDALIDFIKVKMAYPGQADLTNPLTFDEAIAYLEENGYDHQLDEIEIGEPIA